MTRRIFGSIAAQHDNLGDIAIRRVFFSSLMDKDRKLILLSQGMPRTYIDLFNFPDDVELIASPFRFQMRLVWEALNRRADLVYAPGPHKLVDKPLAIAKTLLMLCNIGLVRITGGIIQTAGRSLRGDAPLAGFLERRIISMSRIYAVRDSASEAVAKRKLVVAPDLAFGMDFSLDGTQPPRDLIACSFRNDTKVDLDVFGGLVKDFQAKGYRVALVSQVRRDDSQHSFLAERLNIETHLWGQNTHAEQQKVVESVYNKAHAVISNRLHGLIFGIVAGAVPVEYRIGNSDKISSTISPWFGSYTTIDNSSRSRSSSLSEDVDAVIDGLSGLDDKVRSARVSVGQMLTSVSQS